MPIEPTEDDARRLLAKAAATIKVDEAAAMTLTGLPEPRHWRWPILATAVAVVLAIGCGLVVTQQLGDDPAPADRPVADGRAVEGRYPVADDQLPSVLGYTEHEAVELLESIGLQVTVVRVWPGCLPNGVITTEPGTGAPIGPGDPVTLRVGDHSAPNFGPGTCGDNRIHRELAEAWKLLRFALGLGPSPRFANELALYAGNSDPKIVTAKQAVDPASWTVCDASACHSALLGIQQVVSQPWPLASGAFATPYFNWSTSIEDAEKCGYSPDPVDGENTWVVWVHVEEGMNDWCRPPMQIQIEFDRTGAITAVGLRIRPGYLDDPAEIAAVSAAREQAAEQFVTWARGDGPAPEFADRVRLLQGGGPPFGAQTWLRDPRERWLYSMCSGLPPGTCAIDPIYQLDHYDGPVVPATGRALCVEGTEDLPPYLAAQASDDLVRLTKPEPPTCQQDLPVELWIDDDGLIYAVNLAGRPGT